METPEPKIASKSYIDENGLQTKGELAQMVERSIRIREAPGSMPGFSRGIFFVAMTTAQKVGLAKVCYPLRVPEEHKGN